MRKLTTVLFFILAMTPLFNVYAQENIPIRDVYPRSKVDLFFYLQFILILAFGIGLPLCLANWRWSKVMPKKYGSLTAITYMIPSIFGVICATIIIGRLRLFDPVVEAAARRAFDSPTSGVHLSGMFFGFVVLIPLFLITMRVLYFFKKKRWDADRNRHGAS
tara:strand:+ start:77724 stop:78209 length:486 start_codon:yes stop_codon:yes gene_type:complete